MKIYHRPESIILCNGLRWYRSNSALCFIEVYPFVTISQGLFYIASSSCNRYLKKVLNEYTIS